MRRVFISHAGYPKEGAKYVVVESDVPVEGMFRVVDTRGKVVYEGRFDRPVKVSGWRRGWFARGEFSEVREPGEYAVCLEDGIRSEYFPIAEDFPSLFLEDIVFYFRGQRCSGVYDRKDRSVPLYGSDRKVDVHGGWYDASGDFSKYLSHLAYTNYMCPQHTGLVVWSFLHGYELLSARGFPRFSLERVKEEALYGADFLVRMQDPEGFFYLTVFDRWSHDPEQREVCSYETQHGIKTADYKAGFRMGAGAAIAALARASLLGEASDYSPEEYLAVAERGFSHLLVHNAEYLPDGKENIIDEYCALLAAVELYRATGKETYRKAAEEFFSRLEGRLTPEGVLMADEGGQRSFFHAVEAGFPYVSVLRMREVLREDGVLVERAEEFIKRALAAELARSREVPNPFGYPRQYVKLPGKEGRVQFFVPHENESGYWWQGENARLASLAAASFWAVGEGMGGGELRTYGEAPIYWILGLNPFDVCMMQGKGRHSPPYERGFPNAPGGICNGITSGVDDEEDIAFLPEPYASDMAHRWRWAEQWIPHAAWFFLALSIYAHYGG
ncbi:glycoside hydrolase family 9 [Spirochaeta thermophila DSM 6578]|uniref:Glycoside hydrolase family 9 n=1 Tax=Winmispira thermophila (strain ATCC 700085 / DSM 6578 / Z-1203) TaxID=869211 RepID=G0GDA7_WINT7|nr:glycoside hydrolase family 9 protein [Spirochaeta thermophila]AEJ60533.1 glycoside hydrolase family 9 [Spirochaeta thermophila DSM 6578]